jgi:hypothetical protein
VQESLRDEKKPSHNSNMGRVTTKVKERAEGAVAGTKKPRSIAAGRSVFEGLDPGLRRGAA